MRAHKQIRPAADGIISVLAMVFLALFAALSVAYVSSVSLNVAQASNQRTAMDARLAAESGMSYLTYELQNCGTSGALRGEALLDSLASKIGTAMNASANLGGQHVTYDGTTITIPAVTTPAGDSFTGKITLPAADTLRLTVTGRAVAGTGATALTVQRQVSMDFHPTWDPALGYGMVSKGPVEMGMNNTFVGLAQASDGSIYSAAPGVAVACGSGHISGDVSVSAPGASVSLGGVQVDGQVRFNAPPVSMPNIDRTPYKNAATLTVMNNPTPPAGTYKNIVIPPNTNPTFNSAVTIQGILYIQAPNKIYFNNNCIFTGVMVMDDPPAGSPDTDNYVYYKNNMTFSGPENLPANDPAFTNVRALQGMSVLAPGFTFEFKNNMASVGGLMAVKSLTVKNNETSTVYGSLLIYGDAGLDFKNNDSVTICLSYSTPPPGFAGYGRPSLAPDPSTYVEK